MLLELTPIQFTLKRDFNLVGFKVKSKPDYLFKTDSLESDEFVQINKTIEVTINEAEVMKLINAGHKVMVIATQGNELSAFGYSSEEELELLEMVAEF